MDIAWPAPQISNLATNGVLIEANTNLVSYRPWLSNQSTPTCHARTSLLCGRFYAKYLFTTMTLPPRYTRNRFFPKIYRPIAHFVQ